MTESLQNETFFASADRAPESDLLNDQQRVAATPLLRSIIDAMPNFVMVLNRHRQIVCVNSRLTQAFGEAVESWLQGMRPGEVLRCLHAKDAPGGCGTARECSVCGAVLAILASQSSSQTVSGECRVTLDAEMLTSLDLEVTASPLELDGSPLTLFTMKDISAEKRRNVLERVFFHDVLNVAGGIRGVASLLVEGLTAEKETLYKQWMLSLSDNLIDDISHQRRLFAAERGEYQPAWETTDIRAMLDEVRCLYENHARTPGRKVELGSVDDCVFITDQALLRRIVGNMVLNALEASKPGDTVMLSSSCATDTVSIEVTNPGEMPESVQLQLFKRSFSTKNTAGRGIGTYSMKLFGERYLQGQVGFRSGNGSTTFFITVPRNVDLQITGGGSAHTE